MPHEVLQSCIDAGLVGAEGFAVDASVVKVDTNAGIIVDVEATPAHRTLMAG